MQSSKTGHRNDGRQRSNRPAQDQGHAKNHNDLSAAFRVGAMEGATRVANLKLLLARADGDVAMLAAAVQLKMPGLQHMLDGEKVISSELATHIEETLALDQGWLDRKHDLSEISAKTVDILHGRDISDFEKEIRHSEQQGQDIMKTATANPTPQAAPSAPVAQVNDVIIETRIGNLTLLTQARGAKSRLARALGVSESVISFLFNRKKEFSSRFARDFEKALHLPAKWLDHAHEEKDVPEKAWAVVGRAGAVAPGASSKQAKLPHQDGLTSLKLNFNAPPTELELLPPAAASQAPSSTDAPATASSAKSASASPAKPPATTPAKPAPKPAATPVLGLNAGMPLAMRAATSTAETLPELDDEPVASAPAARETAPTSASAGPAVTIRTRSTAKSGSAPKTVAALPEAQSAPAVAVEPAPSAATAAPAPGPITPVLPAEPAPSPLSVTVAAPQSPPAAPAQLPAVPAEHGAAAERPAPAAAETRSVAPRDSVSPIVEALLKTLTLRAHDGTLSDKEAYRLLGEIAGL